MTETAKQKAREKQRLATTMDQMNQMLGECHNLPSTLFHSADPEQHDVLAFPVTYDWPRDLLKRVREVMVSSCPTPSAPEFHFELTNDAAEHNLAVLARHDFDLEKTLAAQKDSPLGPGQEFRPPDVLRSVFCLHPLWLKTEDILTNGSKWPLEDLSKESRISNLYDALTFGNHKGASSKPDILKKLVSKDVKYGYSVPIPLTSVKKIPGLEMAPMNIMEQNTIDELGRVVPTKVGNGAPANQSMVASNESFYRSAGTAFASDGS